MHFLSFVIKPATNDWVGYSHRNVFLSSVDFKAYFGKIGNYQSIK
ncbi:hypothetical protein [Isorropodon fossajaponicum symbiont]|nr:hypothetical protein [Isorropodon fossajaponicum symbiont]